MCGKRQITEVVSMNPREYEPLAEEAIARGLKVLNQLVVDGQKGNRALMATAISPSQPPK